MPHVPQPAPKKGSGWTKWLGIFVAIVAVLGGALRLLAWLGDDSGGGGEVKLIAQGALGAQPEYADAYLEFLAAGTGSTATFYMFDEKGTAKTLATVNETGSGALIDVALGDMYNNGNPVMVAIYEQKIVIAGQNGKTTPLNAAVKQIRVGDFDGDGKNETIFVSLGSDGKDQYTVWRYSVNQDESKELIKLGGRTAPELFSSHLTADNKDLMLGYVREDGLQLVLYNWDNIGGPRVYGKYPVEDKPEAPAFWVAGGGLATGPALLLSRGGEKPTVEVLSISKEGAESLGRVELDGTGEHTVAIGQFTGDKSEIIAIDEQGKYFIYSVKN